ncbi:muscarinic acetylcholine receptor M2-like [Scyliorhinus canicula]|uniref:muscarinic acetylcholine receptor M2-like n=1 Tax=Scyliorhinus canicula TaxID=7830 RepID=UPI0018F77A32|nr:muscarinic acetylcholine receptor M2-like [Scyliorhinus canicula]
MANASQLNESRGNVTDLFDPGKANFYKVVEIVLTVTATGSLSLVTIIGNILVIVSIKVNRHLQSINNYFLLSLACADLIIGVFSMNLFTLYTVIGYWPLGPVVCDLWLALDYVVSNTSALSLLIISFDRYFCVTKPLSYPVRRTGKVAGLMIAATWVVPFVIWAPPIFLWQFIVGERTVGEDECYIQFLSNPPVIFGTTLLTFYLPVLILIILSVKISHASKSRIIENKVEPTSSNINISHFLMKDKVMEQNNENLSGAPDGLSHSNLQSAKIPGEIIIENRGQEKKEPLNESTSPSEVPSNRLRMENLELSCLNIISKIKNGGVSGGGIEPSARTKEGNDGAIRAETMIIRMTTITPEKRKRAASREKKVTRTVLAIFLVFIITLSPYFIMVLIYTVCSSCVPYIAWTIGYWLCYVNSTLNPACYALCNPTFRKTFKCLLMCQYKNICTIR